MDADVCLFPLSDKARIYRTFSRKRAPEGRNCFRRAVNMAECCRVCVTGASGYIGSWLVKKLLEKGHVVHATVRDPDDPSKTTVLKSLRHAANRLHLFKADLYHPEEFEQAIAGCEYVFHVAVPLVHDSSSVKFKDTFEVAVGAMKSILEACERSGTVKRLIHTGSAMAASPLREDGKGFLPFMDDSCWTPQGLKLKYCEDFEMRYILSKTLSEKELLTYTNRENTQVEVVSLACGLVGGDTLLPYLPASFETVVSQLTGDELRSRQLKVLQELWGSIALLHIDDVCEAHIFCMERPSMAGRFLCAQCNPTMEHIWSYYYENYPELYISKEFMDGPKGEVCSISKKLIEMGFEYKYDMKKILDDSVATARRLGYLK